jgi:RNA polymerase sigma-70 factor (ECF subfamily)
MSVESILVLPHEQLRQPLIRYLVSLGLSGDESQDVAQEAFLRLHRHVAGGGAAGNLRSWLFRVAHNEARNRQKTYARRYGSSMDGVDAPDASDPERSLLAKERRCRLERAVRELPDLERECLRLRAGGRRYREISETMGVPLSTVAGAVERAIRKLAEEVS